MIRTLILLTLTLSAPLVMSAADKVYVGAEKSTEDQILAEVCVHLLQAAGIDAQRKSGKRGTQVYVQPALEDVDFQVWMPSEPLGVGTYAIVARKDFVQGDPRIWPALKKFEGKMNASLLSRLTDIKEKEQKTYFDVAELYLQSLKWNLIEQRKEKSKQISDHYEPPLVEPSTQHAWQKIFRLTREHIFLVFVSLGAAILLGIPIGIMAYHRRWAGHFIMALVGVAETIPALAMFCIAIPLLGVGTGPVLLSLFIYSLLPIIKGTHRGLRQVRSEHLEMGLAMGLTRFQILRHIQLPIASSHMMPGVNRSAVMNVGLTTFAALIGAGGFGTLILAGLALHDISTIFKGALPVMVLAFLVHWFFEFLEYVLVPKPLQKK